MYHFSFRFEKCIRPEIHQNLEDGAKNQGKPHSDCWYGKCHWTNQRWRWSINLPSQHIPVHACLAPFRNLHPLMNAAAYYKHLWSGDVTQHSQLVQLPDDTLDHLVQKTKIHYHLLHVWVYVCVYGSQQRGYLLGRENIPSLVRWVLRTVANFAEGCGDYGDEKYFIFPSQRKLHWRQTSGPCRVLLKNVSCHAM